MGIHLDLCLPVLTIMVLTCGCNDAGQITCPSTSHWIHSSLSFFEKYQDGVAQILETSATPTSVSADINGRLDYAHSKLSFIITLSQGKTLSSPGQELWVRGILRFYLSQASSSVLNNIGAFPIGTQVSLVNLCKDMVAAFRDTATQHIDLCSNPRFQALGDAHLIPSNICLNLNMNEANESTFTRLTKPPGGAAGEDEGVCTPTIWTPVANIGDSTYSKVIVLFEAHPDPEISVALVTKFREKMDQLLQFRQHMWSGKYDHMKKRATHAQVFKWGAKKFRDLNSQSAAVVDAVFDKLGPKLQQTLREMCREYIQVLAIASDSHANCHNIDRGDEYIQDRVCWLSKRAMET